MTKQIKATSPISQITSCRRLAPLALLLSYTMLAIAPAFAVAAQQQTFATPDAAVKALEAAANADDQNALESILGSDSRELVSSGDPVADNNAREDFVRRYNQMHRLAYDDRGRLVLYIGAENWPMPIPLVKQGAGWVFDTASAKDEMLFRRIGRNELFTIDVLETLAEAQQEYASEARDGAQQFAAKIVSEPGKHDGLYWVAAAGEPESPIGPLVASANAAGYKKDSGGAPIPFHGYFYEVLTRQGKNAPGGAKSYIQDGKMTGGFAFLAYPAEYRSSGVMTFMIDQDGVVVEKDLGTDTARLASEISEFNPDKTWSELEE
ncbi:MAG TPA: DUF2950 domain-containing protein [Candidatus Acidoferrales bacterium]|nr:DUF2950 domain-containing protein [Candidatus Acidoferrales bacterium]